MLRFADLECDLDLLEARTAADQLLHKWPAQADAHLGAGSVAGRTTCAFRDVAQLAGGARRVV
jgi:hypothetical protein